MITLFVIGAKLADRYGTDEHDVRLDKICAEIKASVHQTYRDNGDEIPTIMRDTGYHHVILEPKPVTKEEAILHEAHQVSLTLKKSLQNLFSLLPAVLSGPSSLQLS